MDKNKEFIMQKIILSILSLALLCGSASADAISDAAAVVLERNMPAMAVIRYTLQNEEGQQQPMEILGMCVDSDRGVFMAVGVSNRLPRTYLRDFRIALPSQGGQEVSATFLGLDDETGVAFLTSDQLRGTPAVTFGESERLALGQVVFGLSMLPEMTGYSPRLAPARICATTRIPGAMYVVTGGQLSMTPGAPVFDDNALLVGMVSVSRNEPGMVFIGSDEFVGLLDTLPTGGRSVRRAWMGVVDVTPVSSEDAAMLGIADRPAVQISALIPGQPAAQAGLRELDLVVAVNGEPIEPFRDAGLTARAFMRSIRRMPVGSDVILTVVRDGQEIQLPVTLSAEPASPAEMPRTYNRPLGLAARELTIVERYGRRLGAAEPAVVVDLVRPDSPAASAGIQPGDLVTGVGETPTPMVNALDAALNGAISDANAAEIVLQVRRGSDTLEIRIPKPQAP